MSETTNHEKVRMVAGATSMTLAAEGAVALCGVLAVAVRALSVAAQRAFRELSSPRVTSLPPSLESARHLQSRCKVPPRKLQLLQNTYGLRGLEVRKVAALLSLQSSNFAVHGGRIEQVMTQLCRAGSAREFEQSRKALFSQVAAEHHALLTTAITNACTRAARKIGFINVRIQNRNGVLVRVVASDPSGQFLVSEIDSQDPDREPLLRSEVVNAAEGTCQSLVDAYEKALQEEGVRSEARSRKPTGGVCQLAAAKEISAGLSRPPAITVPITGLTKGGEDIRRTRLLNQKLPARES